MNCLDGNSDDKADIKVSRSVLFSLGKKGIGMNIVADAGKDLFDGNFNLTPQNTKKIASMYLP